MALTSERRGRVAVLTLSRPDRLNAIGTQTLDLLASAVEAVHQDAQTRALVIAGAGRPFCAGADLSEIQALPDASGFPGLLPRMTAVSPMIPAPPNPPPPPLP